MKAVGYIFTGLCLFILGIVSVKLGWFDFVLNWIKGLIG